MAEKMAAGGLETRLRGLCLRGERLFYSLPAPHALTAARRPGQTTVEYLMMLAIVAGMAAMMAVLFHKRILGGLFTLVGMIIGAGAPK
ncbi:MAG: hypothetical protein NDI60_01620 [Elusimicrobiales bacterium]|nr:hypothetical protein [Elusimicrobiales bacterium]